MEPDPAVVVLRFICWLFVGAAALDCLLGVAVYGHIPEWVAVAGASVLCVLMLTRIRRWLS